MAGHLLLDGQCKRECFTTVLSGDERFVAGTHAVEKGFQLQTKWLTRRDCGLIEAEARQAVAEVLSRADLHRGG